MSDQNASSFDLGARAAEAGFAAISAWTSGLHAFSEATADYATACASAAGAALEQISGADPQGASEKQAEFIRRSWSGMVEHATTVGAIAADTGRDMMRPFESLVGRR